jgi:hypothetical protein
LRSTVYNAFQRDSIGDRVTREKIRGRMRMEIKMDREGPQKEEEGEGHPRAPQRLFYPYQNGPGNEEDEVEENESMMGEREVKMA